MIRTHTLLPRRHVAAAALAISVLAACGRDGASSTVSPTATTPPALVAVLDTAINDEYHAETIYLRVLADFGNVLPFYNVVVAEQRHSASLATLYERRGLTVPASAWNADNVPRFVTLTAACAAGAQAEVANIAMYDRFLALELPTDVRTVLVNNRRASIENHYPAFLRCS